MNFEVRKHLEKDNFFGGFYVRYIALKDGENVFSGGSGYDMNKDAVIDEKTGLVILNIEKFKDVAMGMLETNSVDYDELLIGYEANLWNWKDDFERLDEKDQWLIKSVLPHIYGDDDLKVINTVSLCLSVAKNRIIKEGFGVDCTRCGGSGNYSRNARGDSRCYKCAGRKQALPRLTKKKMKEIEEHFGSIVNK